MAVTLRFDPTLVRREGEMGVCRCALYKDVLKIEAAVKAGENLLWLYVAAKNYRGRVPEGRQVPSLTKTGPSTWAVEPWRWEPHTGLPPGSTLTLTDVPEVPW